MTYIFYAGLCGSTRIVIFPAQWLDGLWRALPGDEFVLVSGASRIGDTNRPGWADASPRKVDCSNDSQDHTLLPYAPAPFVPRAAPRSRFDPPCDCLSRRRRPRPPHPKPRFVTTANRPFSGSG